ncbi:MAG: replication-associated recombination protein A [Faecalibacillus sp.]
MSTLAYRMRPLSLHDILGQEHIIGQNGLFTKFVEKKHPMSLILYGPPGCGKTTLAMALAHDLDMPYRIFNASIGNKKEMDAIIEEAKLANGLFLIIDEVHRLNKMKQDNLLPYVENGLLIIAGCTTANPFHSINPAIRSRCQIVEVKSLTEKEIIKGLHLALTSEKGLNHQYQCDEKVLKYIADLSSGDIRFAYNCLELCSIVCNDNKITIEDAKKAIVQANGQFDKDEDQYYDTLSGLQKSIRGSDPDGAMYYLAKLIEYDDIESLERRVLVCAYEDIGLANPNACMRTVMAFQAAKIVGFPEARIPIASAIIDLCLSPKSKSSENAIDNAIQSLKEKPLKAPSYLRLSPVGLEKDERYDYSRPELWEYIQYLPKELSGKQFYIPWMTSQYEKALAENYRRILKHGRTSDIKSLNHTKKK